ncbi:MAG TPA: hypothetical protein VIA18_17375, partial [Polyangia bacterium]|nr:hypothetical protein [Polyangia bacterium]
MKAHSLFTLCLASIVFGGCHFTPHGGDVDFGAGARDLATGNDDMTVVGGDGGAQGDMPNLACAPNATSCSDANTLETCNAGGSAQTSSMCPLGCSTDGSAHCKVMQPTAPVTGGDLADGDLTAPAPFTAAKLVFDVSSGQILDPSAATSAPIREANTTSGREVHEGIAFRVSNNVAIWTFKGLTVPASTTIYFDNSKANHAAALVSTTDATIAGTIDGRAYDTTTSATCVGTSGGPGGGAGATSGVAAVGDGAGASAKTLTAGGGGAGFGVAGGVGGDDTAGGNAGAAGAAAGDATLSTIRGGFGGGFGGANGGGGGGSVQLVANGTLTFAAGSVVNVGGCGG